MFKEIQIDYLTQTLLFIAGVELKKKLPLDKNELTLFLKRACQGPGPSNYSQLWYLIIQPFKNFLN